jgi:hypothetical protein
MADSLGDVLNKKNYGEPPELAVIRAFVQDLIGMTPRIYVRSNTYFVTVNGAGAAGALRVHIYRLERQLGPGKKVVLKIS